MQPIQNLVAHNFTVTRISFSNGRQNTFLASASRDNFIAVFKYFSSSNKFDLCNKFKGHARIIWDLDWTPDDSFLASASRDKFLKIWSKDSVVLSENNDNLVPVVSLKFNSPPSALSWLPLSIGSHFFLAVGLENGEISIYKFDPSSKELSLYSKLSPLLLFFPIFFFPNLPLFLSILGILMLMLLSVFHGNLSQKQTLPISNF